MSAVLYESSGHVATITLNRPEKRNAINEEMSVALREAWERLARSDDRVAILTGAGDEAFSAGVDLKDPPRSLADCLPGVGLELDEPVIVAVSGWCVGGAGLFVLLADLAVASHTTRFSFPEPRLGDFGGVMTGLVSRIPYKFAMEFLLLGEELGASRAAEIGFINKVVPAGSHMGMAREWASRIAAGAPLVTQAVKNFARATVARGPLERAHAHVQLLAQIRASEDRREGLKAFAEKRSPKFTGG